MNRKKFREDCVKRDNNTCIVPSCNSRVDDEKDGEGDIHHIIERKLWPNGGYIKENGVSICNYHHRLAEKNVIPPQAFWKWIKVSKPPLPDDIPYNSNKWGEQLKAPPWKEHRDNIKYPSTRHLPWSHKQDRDDTNHPNLENFIGYDLVASIKMDGSNCMIVKDSENPVRARNGKQANKEHFDLAKKMYWENNYYNKIPKNLQIFGEWLYAKHSIHYGCNCATECQDIGPALEDYFQVFGIYDNKYDIWLSWKKTLSIADELNLTVVPPVNEKYEIGSYKKEEIQLLWDDLYDLSQKAVEQGHEGIIVRSKYPFYYSQIDKRLGKYVRPNHVKENEKHWSKRELKQNILKN